MLYFGSIRMDHVISEPCYNETILQRNYRKMTISWSFPYNPFVKFHNEKIGSHNVTVLKFYSYLCYNEMCYNGAALYIILLVVIKYS